MSETRSNAKRPVHREIIDRHIASMYPAIAMLAGVELDVFTPLVDGAMDGPALADALGVSADKLEPLLYALVIARLLTVDEGRFANTAESDRYLVRDRPDYKGRSNRLQPSTWASDLRTAETIRSGTPCAKRDFAGMSGVDLLAFYRDQHGGALATGMALVDILDLRGRRHLLDVAGGSGGLAIAACRACPDLRATVVDIPAVTPITRDFIAGAKSTDRIDVVSADVIESKLEGQFDVAVLCNFIQVISRAQAQRSLRHIAGAVEPGGILCIVGEVLDNSRLEPREIAVSNFAFLNIYDEGRAYTEGEYRAWFDNAGFADLRRTVMSDGKSIITALRR